MHLVVFGAGGRTGRIAVGEALARGHAVRAVVRRPSDTPLDAAATTMIGDARDPAAVATALAGMDAVLSAMGPAGDRPGTSYSEAVAALVSGMEASLVRRLVITANVRVLDDRPLKGPFAEVSHEHRRSLDTLRSSALEWTVVATPMLSDAEPRHAYEATLDERGEGRDIARGDYAIALVDALDHDDWIGHVVDVAG